MNELSELRDREAIQDVLYRHAHAINRFEAQLLATVYWPNAIDHSTYVGSRDDYIAWFMVARPKISSHSHRLGNVLTRLDGARACVQSSASDWETTPQCLCKVDVIGAHAPQDPSFEFFGNRLLQPF